MDTTAAITLAKNYLVAACEAHGRFRYKADSVTGDTQKGYNVIRHAGAVYSLAAYAAQNPADSAAGAAITKASAFLVNKHIGLLPVAVTAPVLPVWAKQLGKEAAPYSALGAGGLALTALVAAKLVNSSLSVSTDTLEAIGRFVLLMQKPDGSFYDRYVSGTGPIVKQASLYYPGEAIQGLVALYTATKNPQWLIAAGKSLSYLVQSRKAAANVPADHWAMIATAQLLPFYGASQASSSQADMTAHVARIATGIVNSNVLASGRPTPIASRIEGLVAALSVLPTAQAALITKVRAFIEAGMTYLLSAQIQTGSFAGAFTNSTKTVSGNKDAPSLVRIDYVQHALSAMLAYKALPPAA